MDSDASRWPCLKSTLSNKSVNVQGRRRCSADSPKVQRAIYPYQSDRDSGPGWEQIMSNVIVVAFLSLVAVAPMAYLGVMATAVKRSDSEQLVLSGR